MMQADTTQENGWPARPMYLFAGNFPSQAANSIQSAKMAGAYSGWLPRLEGVAMTGPLALRSSHRLDLCELYGLERPLKMRYLPWLWRKIRPMYDARHRPPEWYPQRVGLYAAEQGADLVFTRKDGTAVATLQSGVPTVLETHVYWEMSPLLQENWAAISSSSLLALVVVTRPLADSFIRAGIPAEKVLVEPDGVDLHQFSSTMEPIEARRRLGLDIGRPICLYCGHLHDGRGISEILDAAETLRDVEFLFVGGWDHKVKQYRRSARERGLRNVRFVGHVPHREVPLYLFSAEVLLMPHNSYSDLADRCSPLKMFEYLASGRPIIASDLPILRDVLRHEDNALLIEPDSSGAIVNAVRRLLETPTLSASLSAAAREDSLKYSWEERARRILTHALQ